MTTPSSPAPPAIGGGAYQPQPAQYQQGPQQPYAPPPGGYPPTHHPASYHQPVRFLATFLPICKALQDKHLKIDLSNACLNELEKY